MPSLHHDPLDDERLSAYLDDELSEDERRGLDAELAADAELRQALAQLQAARALLADAGPVAAPPDLLDELLEQIADLPPPRRAWYRRPLGVPLEALAIAALALLVVWVTLPDRGATPDQVAPAAAPQERAAGSSLSGRTDEATKGGPAKMIRVPYRYRLTTPHADVLYGLSQLAEKHAGALGSADEAGRLQIERLDRGAVADVVIALPAAALQPFARDLERYGQVEASPDGTVFNDEPVELQVRVELQAAAPKKSAAPIGNTATPLENTATPPPEPPAPPVSSDLQQKKYLPRKK